MASEAVSKFLEALAANTDLQQEVEEAVAAGSERLDAATAVARGYGYEFTVEDLKLATEAKAGQPEELSDAELHGVTGGLLPSKGGVKRPGDPRYY